MPSKGCNDFEARLLAFDGEDDYVQVKQYIDNLRIPAGRGKSA